MGPSVRRVELPRVAERAAVALETEDAVADLRMRVAEAYVAQERVAAEDWDSPEMSVYNDL